MTWKSFHHRGEILTSVTSAADSRRDGLLPMDVDGVPETFGDELTLLAALQLRWHTRLAGRIEHELMSQPMDLENAVVTAWHHCANELPGIRLVIDHHQAEPLDDEMAQVMGKAADKEHLLLAAMAGRSGIDDHEAALQIGARIESRARATLTSSAPERLAPERPTILARIKAAVAA